MKTIVAYPACLALLLLVLSAAKAKPVSETEAKQLIAWFDSLGFPDLAKCKCVRVFTGIAMEDEAGKPKRNYSFEAFLVKDEKDSFTVFTPGLGTTSHKKSGPGVPDLMKVGFEELPIEKAVTAYRVQRARELANPYFYNTSRYAHECLHLFVWARFCAAHGLEKRAFELLSRVEDGIYARETIRGRLTDIIANGEIDATNYAFANPKMSRKELLDRYAWVLKHFSASVHAERAKASFDMLIKMIAEDEAHTRRPPKPLDKMTKQEKIAELIFQLRDQPGGVFTRPGSVSFFTYDDLSMDKGVQKSPAWQLAEMGVDAAPQLIDALDDMRFTRATENGVLRIGQCALAILERIAARDFLEWRKHTSLNEKEARQVVRNSVQAWWRSVQSKGEKQTFIDGVEAGDDNSDTQAERLIAKYPESAFTAIRKGATNSKNKYVRARLIELAAKLNDKEIHAFLLAELRGPLLYTRVAAAGTLLKRGDDAGVTAMLQEWRNPREDPKVGTEPMLEPPKYCLAAFLFSCGKVEIVNTLAKDWRRYSVTDRYLILHALLFSTMPPSPEHDEPKLPKDVVQRIDALLVAALDDEEACRDQVWGFTKDIPDHPRICDFTAAVLAERWNLPNSFDHAAPVPTRDRQRLALKEIWLKKRGKEAPMTPPQK